MKVLIINQHPEVALGGSEVQCDLIARNMTQRGHVVIYGAVGGEKIQKESYPYQVQAIAEECMRRELTTLLASEQPDVVYWRFNKRKLLHGVWAAKSLHIPIVVALSHVRDTQWLEYEVRDGLRAFLLGNFKSLVHRSALAYADGVVSNTKEHLKRIRHARKAFIPNGVFQERGKPFKWPRRFVSWVSNIKGRKHPEYLIPLAKRLQKEQVDILLIGKVQEEAYAHFVHPDQLPQNMHYLGEQPNSAVNAMIAASELFVFTGAAEGFPNVMLQAWAAGKPVVSYEYDPDGIIERYHIGSCAKNQRNQFEQTVIDYLNDEIRREEEGMRGKALVEKSFTVEKSVERLLSFLHQYD